jgi:1,4-dihydroxy-2-naphthoate octaprenyltransferase
MRGAGFDYYSIYPITIQSTGRSFSLSTYKLLLGIMRVPFLVLTPACVIVGVGTAYWQTGETHWLNIVLVFIGGLSAHICVNTFNEYFDFKSGLDAQTHRTPFSGGSGILPSHPEMERATLILAGATFTLTAVIGVYFVWLRGWQLLPIGLLGLILLVTYTIWWTYHPALCLIAPGLGFGLLMVMGAHFALTGTFSLTAFIASLVPTFLVADLLLLNQFPDVEADQSIGRKDYPITIGRKSSSILYGILLLLTYLAIIAGVSLELLPIHSLIALLTAILAWITYRRVSKNADDIPALIPALGMNVIIVLSTPILLSIGLFIG